MGVRSARRPPVRESTAVHLKLVGEVSRTIFTLLALVCYQFDPGVGNNRFVPQSLKLLPADATLSRADAADAVSNTS